MKGKRRKEENNRRNAEEGSRTQKRRAKRDDEEKGIKVTARIRRKSRDLEHKGENRVLFAERHSKIYFSGGLPPNDDQKWFEIG